MFSARWCKGVDVVIVIRCQQRGDLFDRLMWIMFSGAGLSYMTISGF